MNRNLKKKYFFLIIFFFILSFIVIIPKFSHKNYHKNDQLLKYKEIIQNIDTKKIKNYQKIENFIKENKNIYGVLTAMHLSKKYISSNDLDKAIVQLENSLKYIKEENLKNILKLRIVKIKIQKNNHQEAIKILQNIKNKNWISIIENIKGDIFWKKNYVKQAIKSWKKSNSLEKSDASKQIIKMKINELIE